MKDYKLTNLIKEYDGLEPIEKKEYISGVCVSLVKFYETVYTSTKEEAVWNTFKDTEIFCEDHIYNIVSGSS